MSKVKILTTLLLFMAVMCSALTPWGVPNYVDIAAYAVNDYSQYRIHNNPRLYDLSRSIKHKNAFINQLQNKLNAKYPNVSSTLRYNRENSTATRANFLNDNTNLSEFVFFSGHGDYNSLYLYESVLQATAPNVTKTFGDYTRWVIFDACLTLNASPLYLASWLFDGAHVILGNRSITYEFPNSSNPAGYSENIFNVFTTRFVTNGEAIWSSYYNAVRETVYIVGGYGVEPAIAFLAGNADNGKAVNFSEEKLQNVYNGPFNYKYGATNLTINWRSQTYGKPEY
ncbi:MAG: DUF6345 domain-containing protein [Fibromonadaceae bacterium]|jgi:hypothetical protein|nr:DUF6345 domain-containing protein [Fibromonadaceae bacterium]